LNTLVGVFLKKNKVTLKNKGIKMITLFPDKLGFIQFFFGDDVYIKKLAFFFCKKSASNFA
jgi:hypothetical protein